jgi:hypothetical protein
MVTADMMHTFADRSELGGLEGKNLMGYVPSIGVTSAALGGCHMVSRVLVVLTHWYPAIYATATAGQTFMYYRMKARYMLAMTIGLYCGTSSTPFYCSPFAHACAQVFCLGLGMRFVFRTDPTSLAVYIIQDSLIVLAVR